MTDQQQLRAIEEVVARSAEDLRRRHAEAIKTGARDLGQSVVASVEWLAAQQHDDFQSAQVGIEELGWAVESLDRAVRQGFLRLEYYARLVRGELTQIRRALEGPLATQANELRERAEFAAAQGWIDEALRDFLAAEEKNYQDFTVLLNIGNIYLEKGEHAKALGYFEKATTYARPRSAGVAAIALRNAACVRESQGDVQGAYRDASEARQLARDNVQIAYLHAKFGVEADQDAEALESLRFVLDRSPGAAFVVMKEPVFERVRDRIIEMMETLRRESVVRVERLLDSILDARRETEGLIEEVGGPRAIQEIDEECERIRGFLRRKTYVDSRNGERLARGVRKAAWEDVVAACDKRIEGLQKEADQLRDQAGEARGRARKAMEKYKGRGWVVGLTTFYGLSFMAMWATGTGMEGTLAGPIGVAALAIGAATGAVTTRVSRGNEEARQLREADRHERQHMEVGEAINDSRALRADAADKARGLGGKGE